jgi:uncharacterized protein (TIGR00251 family)
VASSPLTLHLKVVPKSSRDRIAGWVGDRLKVQVTAAPERGRANEAVLEVLARALGVPRRSVRLTAGETSPLKTVEVDAAGAALSRLPPRV